MNGKFCITFVDWKVLYHFYCLESSVSLLLPEKFCINFIDWKVLYHLHWMESSVSLLLTGKFYITFIAWKVLYHFYCLESSVSLLQKHPKHFFQHDQFSNLRATEIASFLLFIIKSSEGSTNVSKVLPSFVQGFDYLLHWAKFDLQWWEYNFLRISCGALITFCFLNSIFSRTGHSFFTKGLQFLLGCRTKSYTV